MPVSSVNYPIMKIMLLL